MDNLEDSENNPKVSDSAYSNSCSNSHSRSHSSKSTHSGSSESSGYGGKPSTSGSSNKLEQTSKKDKDAKKRKQTHTEGEQPEAVLQCIPPEPLTHSDVPKEEINSAVEVSPPLVLPEKAVETLDTPASDLISLKHEIKTASELTAAVSFDTSCNVANGDSDGFSCAISMHDGMIMYTTQNLTTSLGFPKEMWIGRSFIDFVHEKDRDILASQITNRLSTASNGQLHLLAADNTNCPMICRIRQYRSLNTGFAIMETMVTYIPCLLKFSFKDITDDDGDMVYLIIKVTPVYSNYTTPNECVVDAKPFVIKHTAMGHLEYVDIESVPYLGYLPQDIKNQDALLLYHPDDLPYLKMIYEVIVKEGKASKSMPYRMLTHNGDYVKLETEFSSFINPWSMKLEFVIAKHKVVEGPTTPNVFLTRSPVKVGKTSNVDEAKILLAQVNRESILQILKDAINKPAKKAKEMIAKGCIDLAAIMENLLTDQKPKVTPKDDPPEINAFDRDSEVMLGGISPHHDSDGKTSTSTLLSYNQLNFNENLERYFESHRNYCLNEESDSDQPQDLSIRKDPNNVKSNQIKLTSAPVKPICNIYNLPETEESFHERRLTESLLTEHNCNMERNLLKFHLHARATGSWKGDRYVDTRQKQLEHLARCNASYQPTKTTTPAVGTQQGIKRAHSTFGEFSKKQQCTTSRQGSRHIMIENLPPPPGPPMTQSDWQAGHAPGTTRNYNHDVRMETQQPILAPQMPAEADLTSGYSVRYSPAYTGDSNMPYLHNSVLMPLSPVSRSHSSDSIAKPATYSTSHLMSPYSMSQQITPYTMSHQTTSYTMSHPTPYSTSQPTTSYSTPQPMTPYSTPQPMTPYSTPQPMTPYSTPQPMTPYSTPQPMTPYSTPQPMTPYSAPQPMTPYSTSQPMTSYSTPQPMTPYSTPQPITPYSTSQPMTSYSTPQLMTPYTMSQPMTPFRNNSTAWIQRQQGYGAPYAYPNTVQVPYGMPPQQKPVVLALPPSPVIPAPSASVCDPVPQQLPLPDSSFTQVCMTKIPHLNEYSRRAIAMETEQAPMRMESPTSISYSQGISQTNRETFSQLTSTNTSSQSGMLSDATTDKLYTDSSSASCYSSSFLKTDSGSGTDSDDKKKMYSQLKESPKPSSSYTIYEPYETNILKRKSTLECMDSELEYKYQIKLRPANEILAADLEKIKKLKQPSLVNEQLGQLYMDLQLEGVAARLTLEEGITSSGSSGDETSFSVPKGIHAMRHKREFNKLSMIHEENAPLPPAPDIPNKFSLNSQPNLPGTS